MQNYDNEKTIMDYADRIGIGVAFIPFILLLIANDKGMGVYSFLWPGIIMLLTSVIVFLNGRIADDRVFFAREDGFFSREKTPFLFYTYVLIYFFVGLYLLNFIFNTGFSKNIFSAADYLNHFMKLLKFFY